MTKVKEEVIAREFRFAYHIPAADIESDDYHFVKEQVHYKIDGVTVTRPEMRLIKNFTRPIFFTRPNLRTHKEKREFESIDNLIRMDVRQSEVRGTVARMVGKPWSRDSLRKLCGSPYVYAADIPSTLCLKKSFYFDKYPGFNSPRTVAMFDTETDMANDIKDIIITSACFENQAFVGIQRRMLEGYNNPVEFFDAAVTKHLKQHIEKHNLKISFYIAESEMDLLFKTFELIHSWRPDFLAIWNMNFDIPKVLAACERAGVDPADLLCDPKIPREQRICQYKEGMTKKVTASGKQMSIKPANQWHTLNLTASFYVIDAMCVYRRIRGGPDFSVALDVILGKELNLSKIRIPEAEKFKKGKWHAFMQKMRIFDYLAYALFDAFSMILLDRKTKDLSHTLPYLCEFTTFNDYSSQTKRLRDNFYLYALETQGLVLGSLGPKREAKKTAETIFYEDDVIEEEFGENLEEEEVTLNRKDWVVTLRAFMTVLGQPLIKEDPKLCTLIRAFVYDSDVVSSYPNCTLVGNVSKRTTRKEIVRIGDVPETVFRMQNLNFVFGATNAIEYSQVMFGLPKFDELNELFKAEKLQQRA